MNPKRDTHLGEQWLPLRQACVDGNDWRSLALRADALYVCDSCSPLDASLASVVVDSSSHCDLCQQIHRWTVRKPKMISPNELLPLPRPLLACGSKTLRKIERCFVATTSSTLYGNPLLTFRSFHETALNLAIFVPSHPHIPSMVLQLSWSQHSFDRIRHLFGKSFATWWCCKLFLGMDHRHHLCLQRTSSLRHRQDRRLTTAAVTRDGLSNKMCLGYFVAKSSQTCALNRFCEKDEWKCSFRRVN